MLQELWTIFSILIQRINFKNSFFLPAIIEWKNLVLSVRNSTKYLISYNLPQILTLIVTTIKELNLLQDLDSV